MRRNTFNIFVGLALIIFGLAACKDSKPKKFRADTISSGAISFASDNSFAPIIDEEVEMFNNDHPKAKLTAIYTNEQEKRMMLEGTFGDGGKDISRHYLSSIHQKRV